MVDEKLNGPKQHHNTSLWILFLCFIQKHFDMLTHNSVTAKSIKNNLIISSTPVYAPITEFVN